MRKRNKQRKEKREARDEARWVILDAANAFRERGPVFHMGQINEAVCSVRRKRLPVRPDVLVDAGFNAEERRR